ncbi:MAG TPA: DUF427 domain-containing protein [Acidimicrobiales bacterium]|nr:DUF427 domain-containing protein [Acidimicrobiales bacterium]
MSLTTGRGPLSPNPAGRFRPPLPDHVVYVEPFRRRVRAEAGGRVVVDSERVLLVHRPARPPTYAFPAGDVHTPAAEPEPEAPGHVQVPWDAVEAWYEEDERVLGHPRNPYHRVDCVRTTRRLQVAVAGVALVDTTDTLGVYETALAPRLYVARRHVRMDLLTASPSTTYCPYKGTASYWTAVVDGVAAEDVAWSYDDPLPESLPLRGLLAFDGDRASVLQDLPPADQPATA